jgi:hypothetical protein
MSGSICNWIEIDRGYDPGVTDYTACAGIITTGMEFLQGALPHARLRLQAP